MNTALLKAAFKQPSANNCRLCTVHALHFICSQSAESLAVGFAASICILDHHLDLKIAVNIFGKGEIARQSEDTPTVYRHQENMTLKLMVMHACLSTTLELSQY